MGNEHKFGDALVRHLDSSDPCDTCCGVICSSGAEGCSSVEQHRTAKREAEFLMENYAKLRAFVEEVAEDVDWDEGRAEFYESKLAKKARKLLDSLVESSGERRVEKKIDGQESADGKGG